MLNPKKIFRLLDNSFVKWILAFQFILTLNFFFTELFYNVEYGDTTFKMFRIISLRNVLMVLILIMLDDMRVFQFAKKVMIIAVLVGCGINVYDLISFNKEMFSPFIGRGAGFYINPNVSVIALLWGLIITISVIPKKIRLLYIMAVGVGIGFTMSRSGVAIFIGCIPIFIFLKILNGKTSLAWLTLLILVGLLSFQTLIGNASKSIEEAVYNSDELINRLNQIANPSISNFSKDTRFENLTYYLSIYQKSPIFGNGIGSSTYYNKFYWQHTSSHNQFLHYMVEFGMLGFIIVFSLIFAIALYKKTFLFSREWKLFAITYLGFSIFSHNLFDHYSFVVCYAFLSKLTEENYLAKHKLIRI